MADATPVTTTSTTVPNLPADTAAPLKEASPYASMLPLLLIFVVFYFLLIRPQQKKLRDHGEMVKNLKRGDKIVTSGGIIATIVKVEDKMLQVEIAPEVKVKLMVESVASVINKPADGEDAKEAKPAKAKSPKSANDN